MGTKEQILNRLRENGEYISGEELSEQLHVSRTAVWKYINSLREEGYGIVSATNRGYRLESCPDRYSEAEIGAGLETEFLGRNIYCFDTIDSTNEEAKRRALTGAPNGSVFVSEQQTGGKGRLGRSFASPAGTGLWFTVLLRPGILPLRVSVTTLLSGLAVARAIRSLSGCDARIKWPNDVVIGSKKVCGILTEMTAEVDRIEFVAVGIGVNVNNTAFPESLREKAISIRMAGGKPLRRVSLLQEILIQFETLLKQNAEADPAFWEEYKSLCVSLDRQVEFTRRGAQVKGVAADISSGGELIVELEDGTRETVTAGEVSVQGIYGH
ncbi:Bifunctional ligase/repressor BirA [Caprobacter fermentans]|uniref:Bifunctional ligase/repressor BirA n=1 Tax=Caproicibacter fermentans TaxID=2576756 RepID=A0A6N8HUY1_9FIRM|nr:biotin--[acetyl-CoA-carboxylase] ligase [Caproicibacter fermentans]MVB09427.1 Bifunctional ligase/repressor BirA [Caproicibacter fermentans]OCN02953.1 biotin--[acetyl-CoA-carboxylase] ligase [Clostridium sp. W14A]QNK41502.1 biotin--[acetyl-CoA-carboxylase] ligase [Caproicibacter fermentans]